MKKFFAMTLLALAISAQAQEAVPDQMPSFSIGTNQAVRLSAAADSLTTQLAISSGAVEMNNFVNVSPAGLFTLFLLKAGIISFANKEMKETLTGFWGGLSINNVMIALGASNPVGVMVGIIGGYAIYNSRQKQDVVQN